MTVQNYKLKNIRLNSKRSTMPILVSDTVSQLYEWGRSDFACFKIINDFFNSIRHNNEDPKTIQARMNRLKDEQILNGINVNNYYFSKIKSLILSLFTNPNISDDIYRNIYSYYLEYLTMQWKKIPGRNGKVTFEPLIKYKRKELFGDREFANSKCDVVYKNNKEKIFSVYECKFGLVTFYSHLNVDTNIETGKIRANGIRAQRKISYLQECNTIFSIKSDVKNLDVKIVTLATRSSIQSSIHLLNGIDLITREDIETPSFFNCLS